ncbi:hypothetical protein QP150_06740 [Sphingomonas sp. 22L2VL55-3]
MSTALTADARPIRILFVFAWLVVGGEETEVRLLAQALDPTRYRIEVVACFRKDGMPEQTHAQLEAIGVPVDRTPYALGFDETVAYLASKLPAYDVVVSCQNVADIYPALERMHLRPPLIEHGGLVSEALAGPSISPRATSASARRSETPPPAACPAANTTPSRSRRWSTRAPSTPPAAPPCARPSVSPTTYR